MLTPEDKKYIEAIIDSKISTKLSTADADARFDALDKKIDRLDERLTAADNKLMSRIISLEINIDFRFQELDERLKSFVDKDLFLTYMDKILTRFNTLEQKLIFMRSKTDRHEDKIIHIEELLSIS